MAVYDFNGTPLSSIYAKSGESLDEGFDVLGNKIFSRQISDRLTVMSFNVGCFYTQYFPCPDSKTSEFYQRHRTIFNNHKPDLCGMQEWNNTIGTIQSSVLMDEFWGYTQSDYVYPVQTAALTMASKFPLSNIQLIQYANQASGDNRNYQKAYIEVNGKQICFVNTHLGTSSVRNAQFLELLSALENEDRFIVFGDFNFRIEAAGDSEYNLSVQKALEKGFHSAQNASNIYMTSYHGETVASSTSTTALDNIITSANIDILSVEVDTTKLTDGLCAENGIIIDHIPIVALLEIN